MAQPTPANPPAAPSRCFICLGDAGEEGDISDWVHPCPCSLEAHHACLLQWVDECEREGKALKCPVCQAPIRVEGARDLAVELSDGIRGFVNGFSPVVVGSMMGGAVVAGQALYGFHAVRVFAGEEAVLSVLGGGKLRESLPGLLGVPLIAPGLVFWQLFPGFTSTISTPFSILVSSPWIPVYSGYGARTLEANTRARSTPLPSSDPPRHSCGRRHHSLPLPRYRA